jgi:hypothetical protein
LHSHIGIAQLQATIAEALDHLLDDGIVDKIIKPQAIRILELELVVVCEEAEEVEGWCGLDAALAVLHVLHERGEQVAVRKVGRERGMEAGSSDGEGGSHRLSPERYWAWSAQSLRQPYARPVPTAATTAHHRVEHGHQVGHDGVGIAQASQHRDDVGAGVRVLFGEDSI